MRPGDSVEPTAKPLRVLVVEDNLGFGLSLGYMLEELGHHARICESAEEALVIAGHYAPHVAFLNIGLPGLDGFDLCDTLRAMPGLSTTLFVAFTGWTGDKFRHRAAAAGFHHYIVKPFTVEILVNVLRNLRGPDR